jgi:hypothetical protein
MIKKSTFLSTISAAAILLAATAVVSTVEAKSNNGKGRGTGPVVYVTSQGLFYDSIVLTDLPAHGPFQLLEPGGPSGLMTEYGPGDMDYVGGRWWMDANGNGMMDDEDAYFMCPLLGPGRSDP